MKSLVWMILILAVCSVGILVGCGSGQTAGGDADGAAQTAAAVGNGQSNEAQANRSAEGGQSGGGWLGNPWIIGVLIFLLVVVIGGGIFWFFQQRDESSAGREEYTRYRKTEQPFVVTTQPAISNSRAAQPSQLARQNESASPSWMWDANKYDEMLKQIKNIASKVDVSKTELLRELGSKVANIPTYIQDGISPIRTIADDLKRNHETVQRDLENARTEVSELKRRLDGCLTEISKCENEKQTMQAGLEDKLKTKDNDITQLKDKIGNLEMQMAEAEQKYVAEQNKSALQHEDAINKAREQAKLAVEKYWPAVALDSPFNELRPQLDAVMQAGNAPHEAYRLFGALHLFASALDKSERAELGNELGKAFYAWVESENRHDWAVRYAEPIAQWLTGHLKDEDLTVQAVADGAAYNAKFHSREGMGVTVKRAMSFLILNSQNNAFRKASVDT